MTDAVELQEDHAGGGRAGARLQLGPPSVGEPVEPAPVRVVVPDGEGTAGGGGDGRHHRGDHHGGLRGGLALSRRDDPQGEPQERAVEEEDEQAEDECGDEEQGPDEERPDDGGEDAERPGAECGRDGDLRRAVPVRGLDSEVGQDPGQRQHGDRGHGPHGNAPPERAHQPPPSRAAHATPTSTPLSDLPQPCHKHASRFGGAQGHDGCSPRAHRVTANHRTGLPLPGPGTAGGVSGRRSPPSASTAGGGHGPSSGRRTRVPRGRPSRPALRAGHTRR